MAFTRKSKPLLATRPFTTRPGGTQLLQAVEATRHTEPYIGRVSNPPKKKEAHELPFRWATAISAGLHVVMPMVLVLLVLLVVYLFSLPLWEWLHPKQRVSDLEFTLVRESNAPEPKDPKFLGEANQQAGGKQDVTELVDELPTSQTQPKPEATPKPTPAPPKPTAEKTPPQKPTPAKPAAINTPAKPENKPTPQTTQNATSATSATATSSNPQPMTNASRPETKTDGNNPPGLAVKSSADFGPYMARLKQRLRRNWHPPRGKSSKTVEVRFVVDRDGKLLALKINDSSGDADADEAALEAVRISAPFSPLPPDFKGSSIPILFTFDYTVYGSSGAGASAPSFW